MDLVRPERRTMLREILDHGGVSEHSAALTFKRGDISWAKKRRLIALRPYRGWQEFYVTEKGAAVAAGR